MNEAIMQLKIAKTEQEKKFGDLELTLIRRLNELSKYSIPYFKQVENIKAAEIKQIGNEIFELCSKALECKSKLEQIKEALGEE